MIALILTESHVRYSKNITFSLTLNFRYQSFLPAILEMELTITHMWDWAIFELLNSRRSDFKPPASLWFPVPAHAISRENWPYFGRSTHAQNSHSVTPVKLAFWKFNFSTKMKLFIRGGCCNRCCYRPSARRSLASCAAGACGGVIN